MASFDTKAEGSIAEQEATMNATPVSSAQSDPATLRGVVVSLVVDSTDKVKETMNKTIGAREYFRASDANNKIMHLALDVGGVSMYLEEIGHRVYKGADKAHARLHLNVENPKDVAEKLVRAGSKTIQECDKQFWGAIYGVFEDPFGVIWSVSDTTNQIEDIPKELESKIMPYAMVTDATGYLQFLQDVFGATPSMEPMKQSNGKIMWSQVSINGGNFAVGDQCDASEGTGAEITIIHTIPKGQAETVCQAFKATGGNILCPPAPMFWGQVWGRCKDAFGQSWGICEPPSGTPPTKEDMAIDVKLGEKYKWKWSWSIEDVPKIYCLGEVRTCLAKSSAVAPLIESLLPAAVAEAGKRGLEIVGPPLSGYYSWDPKEGGETSFTTGPMVAGDSSTEEAAKDDTGLGFRSLGGVKCVTVTHVGPYDELGKCYEATLEWIAAKGYEDKCPVTEIYENDPKDTEPAKLRTKVSVPIVLK